MITLVFLALLAAAPALAQECTADLDGSGHVAVNDLVAAVNQALGECGAPPATPVPVERCPFGLADANNGATVCAWRGRYNPVCGDEITITLVAGSRRQARLRIDAIGAELVVSIPADVFDLPEVVRVEYDNGTFGVPRPNAVAIGNDGTLQIFAPPEQNGLGFFVGPACAFNSFRAPFLGMVPR